MAMLLSCIYYIRQVVLPHTHVSEANPKCYRTCRSTPARGSGQVDADHVELTDDRVCIILLVTWSVNLTQDGMLLACPSYIQLSTL